jgi:hypothetical protein
MTDTYTVTQADRDAAAEYFQLIGRGGQAEMVREGSRYRATAEAFGRHRAEAITTLQAENVRLREALNKIAIDEDSMLHWTDKQFRNRSYDTAKAVRALKDLNLVSENDKLQSELADTKAMLFATAEAAATHLKQLAEAREALEKASTALQWLAENSPDCMGWTGHNHENGPWPHIKEVADEISAALKDQSHD